MMHLVCWAVPVRGGYVLRADQAAQAAVRAANGRGPQLVDWEVTIVHPGPAALAPERLRRQAVLAIEVAMRHGTPVPTKASGRFSRLRRSWTSLALGVALIAVSGAHWVLALAGAWLLAGRPWVATLLRIGAPEAPATAWTAAPVHVTAEPHAGLAEVAAALEATPDGSTGNGLALAQALTLGLDEAAAVYAALIKYPNPMALSVEVGMWMPSEAAHDPALAAASADADAMLEPHRDGDHAGAAPEPAAGDEASDDPMDNLP